MNKRLTRSRYRVALAAEACDPLQHEVEVSPVDQFKAEPFAAKFGLPSIKVAPMQHQAVWVWCAMVRQGLYAGPFHEFRDRDLYAFELVVDEAGDPVGDEVPPTMADPSASASSWPATSGEAPVIG